MRRIVCLLLPVILLIACGEDDPQILQLDQYISDNSDWATSDQIIACAAGGEAFATANPNAPVSIFFYPQGLAYDFKYFETDRVGVNENDLSNFVQKDLGLSNVFNGYLRKFNRDDVDTERWCIVTYRLHDTLWRCKPILLKPITAPTLIANEAVEVQQSDSLTPYFSWEDENAELNAIYFQVVSDKDGNLITGTYTFDQDFQFYLPEEFAPNITDENLNPELRSEEVYNFTLMGVGTDNWVNLLSERTFELNF